MPNIKLNMKTSSMIRQLGRRGSLLQVVAAETVNDSAEDLDKDYKKRLKKKQRLRGKFSLNSTRTFKANPVRRSGEPRQLSKINAITGVRKMKGGKQHYLAKLEEGRTQRGNSKTKNRVPIPLTTARTSQNIQKPIAGQNRLLKGETQTLRAGGKPIGVRGDGFKTSGQRFAILYKYKRSGGEGLTGDLSKPFFFIDRNDNLGIFKFFRGRARKIRTLEQSTARTKASPNFGRAVDAMTPEKIKRMFVKKAERKVR